MMVILIVTSIVLQVRITRQRHSSEIFMQALNGLTQLIMGPLDFDKEEWRALLNILNYLSLGFSYGILAVDIIKMCFGLGTPVI